MNSVRAIERYENGDRPTDRNPSARKPIWLQGDADTKVVPEDVLSGEPSADAPIEEIIVWNQKQIDAKKKTK